MIRKIDDKNAESIGRPIIEKAIPILTQSNHAQFLKHFPGLRVFEGQEIFDAAAENLKLLGSMPSIEYLDQLVKPNWSLLLWLVKSRRSDKAIMLRMELTEDEGEIRLTHLSIKKLFEGAAGDAEPEAASGHLNDDNSESIGRPLIDSLLRSLMASDFELYCQSLPEVSAEKLAEQREIFDEAVGVLKPMGDMISFQYLAHSRIANIHTLFWKVFYQKEDENLLFQSMLSEDKAEATIKGWGFDR